MLSMGQRKTDGLDHMMRGWVRHKRVPHTLLGLRTMAWQHSRMRLGEHTQLGVGQHRPVQRKLVQHTLEQRTPGQHMPGLHMPGLHKMLRMPVGHIGWRTRLRRRGRRSGSDRTWHFSS